MAVVAMTLLQCQGVLGCTGYEGDGQDESPPMDPSIPRGVVVSSQAT
jgi:hypothetical protein